MCVCACDKVSFTGQLNKEHVSYTVIKLTQIAKDLPNKWTYRKCKKKQKIIHRTHKRILIVEFRHFGLPTPLFTGNI